MLRAALLAPEHYTDRAVYEEGKLVIDTDADVTVPDVDAASTYGVIPFALRGRICCYYPVNILTLCQLPSHPPHIRNIKLGYTRIYDPTKNNDTGLLVPAWDFFGGFDREDLDGGSKQHDSGLSKSNSFTFSVCTSPIS